MIERGAAGIFGMLQLEGVELAMRPRENSLARTSKSRKARVPPKSNSSALRFCVVPRMLCRFSFSMASAALTSMHRWLRSDASKRYDFSGFFARSSQANRTACLAALSRIWARLRHQAERRGRGHLAAHRAADRENQNRRFDRRQRRVPHRGRQRTRPLAMDVSAETLRRTSLGELKPGDPRKPRAMPHAQHAAQRPHRRGPCRQRRPRHFDQAGGRLEALYL